jgi:DNA-binding response OmpR family regulator/DNA-binding CsgD family transcriptional regulator|tara:strand:+ start:2157 stop:3068 length:912 start_codon:yes stop_codon:yes gene_type:complete
MTELNQTDIVLVVDDSPDALSLINDALEIEGLDVLVALEGKQALTIAKRIRPDVILLDAVMPVMDGFETCKQLKTHSELADIPVIFMTGLSDTDDIIRGLEAGGVDYLVKPINPAELIARMKVHLNNARLTKSAQSALDSTGQHLFTSNDDGEVKWATPQTYALFAKAKVKGRDLQSDFCQQLQAWITKPRKTDDSLTLAGLDYPLALRFVGQHSNGDWLIKLVDGNRPIEAALLRSKLDLTERESDVLFWIANGKSNREAAEILSMSPRTVNKHLEMIFPKLGVENRTAAAGVALKILASEG